MSKKFFVIISVVLLTIGCAKRGYITGGEVDELPPTVLKTYPENFSTRFNAKEITIQFDEYVKLKDVNKQLIVSPPLKYKPIISPLFATKEIKIRFVDTLMANTTYSLNFGQSIEDNNEANKLQGYRYVFSTGDYIDSLSIKGFIKDAYDRNPENYVSVMLYEVNETFNDSVVFKQNPRYITNTLDSLTTFSLENIKEGNYLLVALKDKNNNYRFDSKSEKIGFYSQKITVPSDSIYGLELFSEVADFKPVRAFEEAKNRIVFGYEGDPKGKNIELRNGAKILDTRISQYPEKDSLNIWYNPIEADSLQLKVYDQNIAKTYTIRPKEKKLDSLSMSLKSSKRLGFNKNIIYQSTTPIDRIDPSKIELLNKDSIAVAFSTKYDSLHQKMEILFDKEEKQRYYFSMFPTAVTDFFGKSNDTLQVEFTTQNHSDYGNLKLILQNVKEFPIIVQLTDDKGKVLEEKYSENSNIIEFFLLDPSLYYVRVVFDKNRNKIWDTGNYLKKIQPEKVVHFPSRIDVRANWDVEQTFTLKD